MKKNLLPVLVLLFSYSSSFAQFSQERRDSINRLNTADHQLMMEKLGIESLRPGPSGNPADPNAANTDLGIGHGWTETCGGEGGEEGSATWS